MRVAINFHSFFPLTVLKNFSHSLQCLHSRLNLEVSVIIESTAHVGRLGCQLVGIWVEILRGGASREKQVTGGVP